MTISSIRFSPFISNQNSLSQLGTQTQQIAQTVASAGVGARDEDAAPRDPEDALVKLRGVSLSFNADTKAMARADELVGTLLDIVR